MSGKAHAWIWLTGGIVIGAVLAGLVVDPMSLPQASNRAPTAIEASQTGLTVAPTTAISPEEAAARQALLVRLRYPEAAKLEDLRTYRFSAGEERAVCGTLLAAELPGGRARFVVRVVLPAAGGPARPPMAILEDGPGLARPAPEVARRLCRDIDPPAPPPVAATEPSEPAQAAPPQPTPVAAVPAVPGAAPASGRVMVQTPANLRTAPGGAVIGALQRGRVLTVFETAPGGWLRVGEGEPQGWAHRSLLSDAADMASAGPR